MGPGGRLRRPIPVTYFYVDQSLVILPVTVFKARLGQVQLFLCIIKALQLFQAEVAPHDVQLQDCIVVHSVQQLFALTTRGGSCHGRALQLSGVPGKPFSSWCVSRIN
ncbi:rCG24364 [Rattus norvegicus]|uniref:RCG24364 n=1 Tax=Rattus norvegicus TaxID=10116 RepID=A6K531_RAT|nr:rCG24364 [Rattus norvegicus]